MLLSETVFSGILNGIPLNSKLRQNLEELIYDFCLYMHGFFFQLAVFYATL